jgi:hypothetical protein
MPIAKIEIAISSPVYETVCLVSQEIAQSKASEDQEKDGLVGPEKWDHRAAAQRSRQWHSNRNHHAPEDRTACGECDNNSGAELAAVLTEMALSGQRRNGV